MLEDIYMNSKVFAIGRFNPPTKGHEEMVLKVLKVARQYKDRYPRIYVTQTHDVKKNPLEIGQKLAYLKAAFPGINFKPIKNIIEAIQDINEEGIEYPILVTGTDRANSYDTMMKKGIEGGHTDFINYTVVPIMRDSDADDASGASATKAREYAKNNNLEKFMNISPSKLTSEQKEMLFHSVRHGMGAE